MTSSLPSPFGLIDVHSHFVQPGQTVSRERALIANRYLTDPAATWSPELAVEFMDARGIQAQLLSHPRPLAPDAARESNNYGATVVAERPDRFGLLANLPLGSPAGAVEEIGRAVDELHADGFVIVTNYDGIYLGDPRLDPVFVELDRRRATVLVHPVEPPGFDSVCCGRPGPVVEFPFDTTRTVVDAIYSRVFRRYPNFNLIVAHGGGVLPSLAWRLASIGTQPWVPHSPELTPEEVLTQIAGLYYDTAVAGTPCALEPLLEVTTAEHIVFGTDFFPAGIEVIDATIDALKNSRSLTYEALAATTENALRLFPSARARLRPSQAIA